MELPACPVETTLMLIGDKWKVLILRDLMDGTKRFGELKKSIGTVSQKVLTAQLRDMEEKGLLTRKDEKTHKFLSGRRNVIPLKSEIDNRFIPINHPHGCPPSYTGLQKFL